MCSKRTMISGAALLFSAAVAAQLSAQVTREKLAEDRSLACGIHRVYTPGRYADTPAPQGYAPFYVSHVGRHGSRYNTNGREVLHPLNDLAECDSAGILTEKGKLLYTQLKLFYEASEGHFGALSEVGAAEHSGIASRMYRRFPEAFSDPARRTVHAASSSSGRCLTSMANFAASLQRKDTTLHLVCQCDDQTKAYILKDTGTKAITAQRRKISEKMREDGLDTDRFFESVFTDVKACRKYVSSRQRFCKELHLIGSLVEDLELQEKVDILSFFTPDELFRLTCFDTNEFFGDHCNSAEFGRQRVIMADEMVEDIIAKADAVLSGEPKAADLRFTHDWMMAPLFSLIGIEGMDRSYSMEEAWKHWNVAEYIPMAANIQMVFYKSEGRETLVKILVNEKETLIPALKPVNGSYYSWTGLRPYLQSRIECFE
ncbi:MAG: histidine-type phosphatase [Candidatus Cryptobacteroides sp.]